MNNNPSQKISIQGHRGCRGLMPENTIPAFKKAIKLGVDTLELDITISKDKKVVVSHEPYMNSAICLDPNGNEIPEDISEEYNLYQMTHEEIKTFDCGTKFYEKFPDQEKRKTYKPSLDTVFEVCDVLNSAIKYNIEIKADPKYDTVFTPEPKEFVRIVLETINKYHVSDRCNLQSFDLRILEEIKIQAPKMEVAILIEEDEDIFEKLKYLSYKPEIISPYYKLLDQETINKYKEQGFKIIPWTVNTALEMQEMIHFNVDGIITDFPDVLLQICQEKC